MRSRRKECAHPCFSQAPARRQRGRGRPGGSERRCGGGVGGGTAESDQPVRADPLLAPRGRRTLARWLWNGTRSLLHSTPPSLKLRLRLTATSAPLPQETEAEQVSSGHVPADLGRLASRVARKCAASISATRCALVCSRVRAQQLCSARGGRPVQDLFRRVQLVRVRAARAASHAMYRDALCAM